MSVFTVKSSSPSFITFASDPANVSQVEPYAERIADTYNLGPEKRVNLLISLTEAVTNAIIHGNKQDRSKQVKIQCAKSGQHIAVRVSDQGPGFNYLNLPDPTSPEKICECGGRGVYLMNALCDHLTFKNGGTTVEMQFRT